MCCIFENTRKQQNATPSGIFCAEPKSKRAEYPVSLDRVIITVTLTSLQYIQHGAMSLILDGLEKQGLLETLSLSSDNFIALPSAFNTKGTY